MAAVICTMRMMTMTKKHWKTQRGARGGGWWGGDPALELAAALTWRMMLGGEAGKPNRCLNHHQLPNPPTPPPSLGF